MKFIIKTVLASETNRPFSILKKSSEMDKTDKELPEDLNSGGGIVRYLLILIRWILKAS